MVLYTLLSWHHISKKRVCSRAIHCASYTQLLNAGITLAKNAFVVAQFIAPLTFCESTILSHFHT